MSRCTYDALPCKGNSLATGDDLVPDDVCECRHKQRVDLATFYQGSARYQVPCAPDQRPFAPHQQNSFQDCDLIPVCPPVSTGIPCAAISIKIYLYSVILHITILLPIQIIMEDRDILHYSLKYIK